MNGIKDPGVWQTNPLNPDTIAFMVFFQPIPGTKDHKVQLIPVQNIHDLWQAFAYTMEAAGTMAASFVRDNPVGVTDYEEMAQYVSEYITKVIMNAYPKEDYENGN